MYKRDVLNFSNAGVGKDVFNRSGERVTADAYSRAAPGGNDVYSFRHPYNRADVAEAPPEPGVFKVWLASGGWYN